MSKLPLYETGRYWVGRLPNGGYGVYVIEATASRRVGTFGETMLERAKGFADQRAKAEGSAE